MGKYKIWLYIAAAILLLGFGVRGCVYVGTFTYSEGERTGTIAKFSHRGLVIKTWEGELHQGGLDQGGVAKVWNFSVNDPAVIEKIHEAQRSGGHYTLKYRQQLMKQSWRGDTEYFITDVIKANQ